MNIMLPTVASLAVIISIGYVLWSRVRIQKVITPFITICGIIAFELIMAGFDLLKIATIGVYGLIGVIVVYIIFKKQESRFLEYISSYEIILFSTSVIVLMVVFMIYPNYYQVWDEFSHWGPFLQNVKYYDCIHLFQNRELVHQAYPQAMTVFYYFYAFTMPGFSENSSYIPIIIVLQSCALLLVGNQKKGNFFEKAFCFLTIPFFFLLFTYSNPYVTIYLDTVLGAIFGAILLLVVEYLDVLNSKRDLALLLLSFVVLVQIKDIALLFAGIIWVVVWIKLFLSGEQKKIRERFRIHNHRRIWGIWLLIITGTGTSYVWWKVLLKVTNHAEDQFSSISISSILQSYWEFLNGNNPYFAQVANEFAHTFIYERVFYRGPCTAVVMLVVLTACGIIVGRKVVKKDAAKRCDFMIVNIIPVFFVGYQIVILFVYIFTMSKMEALRSASYSRYMTSFLIGWIMLLLMLTLEHFDNRNARIQKYYKTCMWGILFVLVYSRLLFCDGMLIKERGTNQAWRNKLDGNAQLFQTYLRQEDRVWVLGQEESSVIRNYYCVTLYPIEVVRLDNVLSEDTDNPTDIIKMIREYKIDYIIATSENEETKELYGKYFPDGLENVLTVREPCLYRAEEKNGSMVFELVRIGTD